MSCNCGVIKKFWPGILDPECSMYYTVIKPHCPPYQPKKTFIFTASTDRRAIPHSIHLVILILAPVTLENLILMPLHLSDPRIIFLWVIHCTFTSGANPDWLTTLETLVHIFANIAVHFELFPLVLKADLSVMLQASNHGIIAAFLSSNKALLRQGRR